MSFYTRNFLRNTIFLGVIIIIFLVYNFAPVYRNRSIDKSSEWYVNGLYLSDQYYYNHLLNDREKEVYKELFEGFKNIENSIEVNVSKVDVLKVWQSLICDHPELINISTVSWRYPSGGSTIYTFYPNYLTHSKTKLRSMERKVSKKVGKIVSAVKGKTDYEKELAIYEYLGKNNAYGQTIGNTDQSAYTVFSMNNTVCAGYGKAAQILFQNCGIDSMININDNHMWNTVKIAGEYYFFDATLSGSMYTLDDVYENISYMGLNHNQNGSNYKLIYPELVPKILGTKYNYYDYNGLTFTYNDKLLGKIKNILDESKYDKVQIRFTNPSVAENGINKNKAILGIKEVIHYTGYCTGNGVLELRK